MNWLRGRSFQLAQLVGFGSITLGVWEAWGRPAGLMASGVACLVMDWWRADDERDR